MKTLSDYLHGGYQHASNGGVDPAPACASAISRGDINAEMQRLNQPALQAKDHVSRVHMAFLRRVVDLMG